MARKFLGVLMFVLMSCTLMIGSERVTMKIMTYNIRHGLGADEVQSIDRILEVISAEEPDILILNEVDRGNSRSGNIMQPDYIAEKLEMMFVFGPTEDRRDYGNAVLSKFPIVHHESFDLKQPKWMRALQRGCVKVTVDVSGTLVDVYGTHLGLGGFQEIQSELGHIYEVFKENKRPSVIAGDFNIQYGELQYCVKGLFDDFISSNHFLEKDILTFPSDFLSAQIDYILLSSGLNPVEVFTVQSLSSDHLPVICVAEVADE